MAECQEDVYILSAVRTPTGSFNGSLSSLTAQELGGLVVKEALRRAGAAAESVSEVFMGQVLTAGGGQNPARQAAMKAGVPKEVPSTSLNMLCGSGLRAVVLGYQAIRCGDASLVVAGGQESMSKVSGHTHLVPPTNSMRACTVRYTVRGIGIRSCGLVPRPQVSSTRIHGLSLVVQRECLVWERDCMSMMETPSNW